MQQSNRSNDGPEQRGRGHDQVIRNLKPSERCQKRTHASGTPPLEVRKSRETITHNNVWAPSPS